MEENTKKKIDLEMLQNDLGRMLWTLEAMEDILPYYHTLMRKNIKE